MEQPLARWMVVTDALRSYVAKRGAHTLAAQARAEIIGTINREIAAKKAMLGHACAVERAELQAEISGAANFLHAFRQADESLTFHG
jgi:hypothetical protein